VLRRDDREGVVPIAEAGGEPGEEFLEVAEEVGDVADQPGAEPAAAAARRDGPAQPGEQGRKTLGRGAGGDGHGG
jgi:hypothetical protein